MVANSFSHILFTLFNLFYLSVYRTSIGFLFDLLSLFVASGELVCNGALFCFCRSYSVSEMVAILFVGFAL